MEQIPTDKHSRILKAAHKYKIEENDPAWILVRLAIESISDIERADRKVEERGEGHKEAVGPRSKEREYERGGDGMGF